MSRFGLLEVRLGAETLRLEEVEADFVEPAGGDVVVDYEAGRASIHVLGRREIADGSLSCSIDGMQRALVSLDLGFLAQVLAEAPRLPAGEDPDADLEAMAPAALLAHAREMRAAIRAHRDASGHELCWHHPELWGLLPDTPKGGQAVPDWPQFLRGCILYRASLDRELGEAPRTTEEYE
ncbi:MAG: hypothetical protein U1E59_00915 [Amaricoccus sp.]